MSGVDQLQIVGNKVLVRVLKFAVRILPIRDPELLVGVDAVSQLAESIARHSVKKILVVTGEGIVRRGQPDELIAALEKEGIEACIFAGVLPDPTFAVVNEGLNMLRRECCDSVVAFGGGSAMDAAKVIAVAASNKCRPERLAGYFKGRKKPLPLFAVPTTAGTGSEVTIAAVISDDISHAKAFVLDSRTVPLAAALDPRLMQSIPPALTAATGMDALTHALEAYLSTIATPETDQDAIEATRLIFENLPTVFTDGSNLQAREAMSLAAFKAGRAITRASIGYVHAISHQLGAHYGTSHGQGNAIVLPYVVEFYLPVAKTRLAQLAAELDLGTISENTTSLARKMLDRIVALNTQLSIPRKVPDLLESDIPGIARGALKEALLNYAVPRHLSRGDCEELLRTLLPV